ncbi:hypothetical protein EGJ05_07540 [Stutzerimonas xanthomarina]|nr:hypothetical protein EGJ05_07540 [Stutzerimonas xanthomarina]
MLAATGVVFADARVLSMACGSLSQKRRYHIATAALQKQNKLRTVLHIPGTAARCATSGAHETTTLVILACSLAQEHP